MSAIVVRSMETGDEVHRIDTSKLTERQRERAFMGVMMQSDLDRFYIDEEE